MSSFSFEEDMLFAPKVKSAYLEQVEQVVYWLNGTGKTHSALMKMIGDDKTRQEGWEKSVYMLACNEDGLTRYQGKVNIREFHEGVDHTLARNYGMLILGISKGDEQSDFEEEVQQEVKNSGKDTGTSST